MALSALWSVDVADIRLTAQALLPGVRILAEFAS